MINSRCHDSGLKQDSSFKVSLFVLCGLQDRTIGRPASAIHQASRQSLSSDTIHSARRHLATALRLQRIDILLKGSILPSNLGTTGSRALLYRLVSICHPKRSPHHLTLLSLAILGRKVSVSTVRRISATVELLITRSLKRAPKVDESVALDTERTFRITTVGDRCAT
jgi:hypothetical protein